MGHPDNPGALGLPGIAQGAHSGLEAAGDAVDVGGLREEVGRPGLQNAAHVNGVPAVLHQRRPGLRACSPSQYWITERLSTSRAVCFPLTGDITWL